MCPEANVRFEESSPGTIAATVLEAVLFILATLVLPFVLLYGLTRARLRQGLAERLARGGWLNKEMASVDLLIHAASVGEVGGLEPVLSRLQQDYPRLSIGISTTSLTGRARAKELVGDKRAVLLPIDHPLLQRAMLRRVRPKAVMITETEIWPSFLLALSAHKIPAVLINARISDYSYPNYHRLRFFFRPLLQVFRCVLTQSELDTERFASLGVSSANLYTLGSTKYDREQVAMSAQTRAEFARELGISLEKPCFVAGSVRPGEDEVVLQAYCRARETVPHLQLIVTPRHPERFDACASLIERYGLEFHRRSDGPAAAESAVVLLDTLGELQKVYALASFSFVGASLVNIGGHNPLEPAAYAAPVLMGPHHSTVRDAVASLVKARALVLVHDAVSLEQALVSFVQNEEERAGAGRRAEQVWQSNVGATARVLAYLQQLEILQEARQPSVQRGNGV